PDAGARALAGDVVLAEPGVFEGQRGADERELHEPVELACLAALDVGRHVDVDLPRDVDAQLGGVEARDVADAVPGLVLSGEELGGADPDRSDGADPGDDDSSHDVCKGTRPGASRMYPDRLGYCFSAMNLTASPTVRMPSASSSEISTPNSSSRPMISSTTSSESAPRSSWKRDSVVTSLASASSLSAMMSRIFSRISCSSTVPFLLSPS